MYASQLIRAERVLTVGHTCVLLHVYIAGAPGGAACDRASDAGVY